jgi:hypothetical protein
MTERNAAPLHLIFVVLALVLFFLAGFGWPAPVEPYRLKLIGAGLFFMLLASFF